MKHSLDLQHDNVGKIYFHYLLPAIASGLVTSLYIIVDGIFIGRGIGSDGLAAVGIVVPMFTMFTGFSLIFGLGGSIRSTISAAEGREGLACRYFTHSVAGITVIMAFFIIGVLTFRRPLLRAFGAEGGILAMSERYLKIMIVFGIPYCLALVLSFFVRADGSPRLAMGASIGGALLNIVFDYLFIFVFKMGVFGAGLATGFGNILVTVILLGRFLNRRKGLRFVFTKPEPKLLKKIAVIGLPSFSDQLFMSVLIILFNRRLFALAGADGVSAYSLIGYMMPFILMIFNGISQAGQPLISANYGSGQVARVSEVLKTARLTALVMGAAVTASGLLLRHPLVSLFLGSSENAYGLAVYALPFMFSSFLFSGNTIVLNVYFQSTAKPRYSFLISIIRGLAATIPLMYLLSSVFGIAGLWWAVPAAEIISLTAAMLFLKRIKKIPAV